MFILQFNDDLIFIMDGIWKQKEIISWHDASILRIPDYHFKNS